MSRMPDARPTQPSASIYKNELLGWSFLDTLKFVAWEFMIVLRGYDMAQVDELFAQADAALSSGSETLRTSAIAALEGASFKQRIRGYAPREVDRAVEQRLRELG